jgi:hypothetical protein
MKKLIIFIVTFISSVSFCQKIDIDVKQVLFQELTIDNNIVESLYKNVNSVYHINLDDSSIVYINSEKQLNVTRKIVEKTVHDDIITIMYEDDILYSPDLKIYPKFVINKKTNTVEWFSYDLDNSNTLKYTFIQFKLIIKEKS